MEEKAETRDLRCRVCLNISDDKMESFTNNSKYKPIVEDFTGLTIQLGDELPSMICSGCISVINILLEFIETCKKSEKILKEEGKLIECEEIQIKTEKTYDHEELPECVSINMPVEVEEEICTKNADDKGVKVPKGGKKRVIIKRRRIRKRKRSASRNNVGLRRFNEPRFFNGLESRPSESVPSRFDEQGIYENYLRRRPIENVSSLFNEQDILDNYLRRRPVEGVPIHFDEQDVLDSYLRRRPIESASSHFRESDVLDSYLRRRPVESVPSQIRESDVLDSYLRRRPIESASSHFRESDVLDGYLRRRPIESVPSQIRESDVLENYLLRRPIENASNCFDEQNISASNLGRRQIENLGSVNIENAQTHIDAGNTIGKKSTRARRRRRRLLRKEHSEQSEIPCQTEFKCRVKSCEKLFTSLKDLKQHIWSNHRGGRNKITPFF